MSEPSTPEVPFTFDDLVTAIHEVPVLLDRGHMDTYSGSTTERAYGVFEATLADPEETRQFSFVEKGNQLVMPRLTKAIKAVRSTT